MCFSQISVTPFPTERVAYQSLIMERRFHGLALAALVYEKNRNTYELVAVVLARSARQISIALDVLREILSSDGLIGSVRQN